MNLQPSICDGFWDIVNVSDIKDVGSFTLRLGGSQEAFGKMMDDVQEVGTNSSTVSTATVGAPVLAQFSFDNQWYRAEITEIHDDGTLTVCYIDYGNMERVKKVNTRANTAFTNLPKQGVECRLHRIDYTKGSISKHQESFRSICLNRTFTALFVSQSSNYIWNVELFHDTGNVNDWFGSQAGVLTAPLVKLPVPSKLPHPHNAGLEPAKVINGVTLDQSERVVPTNFSGTVVYVNNPAQFWLQLASDEEAVMDISAQLAEHCNSSSIKRLNHPVVGQACAALYSEDITWYRGRIEELCGDSAKIYFIDYGNVETVGLDSIAHLPSDLQSIPGYAIEASLHGVESASDHSWTDEESNAFSDIVITCVCEVEVVNEGNEAARQVNLVVQGTPVVNKLVEAGIAKRYPAVPSPVVNGHTQVPPVSHQSTNVYEGGFTRQQVQSGQKELVYISWLVNPANFWVQKANCEGQLAALLESAKEWADQSQPLSNPSAGMSCIAKYSADDSFYRGEITSCSGSTCSITFIDYGNTEEINTNDVFPCLSSLAQIPCQAFQCSLLGITPVSGSDWGSDCLSKMEEMLADGGTCTFLARHGETFLVELAGNGEESVRDTLISSKLANANTKGSQASERSQGSQRSGSSGGYPKHVSMPSPARCIDAAGDAPPRKDLFHVSPATIQNLGVRKEESISGNIVHIETSREIYCQLSKSKSDVDSLYDIMGVFYHAGKGAVVDSIVKGSCYVAQFPDDKEWYRVRVTDVERDNVKVKYIDYGNSGVVSASAVRQLTADFSKLPAQALCCSLFNYTEVLDAKDLAVFTNAYLFSDVTGEIKGEEGEVVMVDMMCAGKPVSQLLQTGSSHSTPNRPQPCLKFAERQIAVGELEGYLVFEVSQQQFYIQLASDTQVLESVGEQLVDLSATSKPLSNPTVGQACIAKFSDDGQWYRAEVVNHSLTEGTDVLFIDYGNSSRVNGEDLLEISAELADIPRLAICCSLVTREPSQSLSEWATELIRISVNNCHHGIAHVTLTDADGNGFTSGGDVSLVAVESSLSSITLSASHPQSPLSNTSAAHSSCNSSPARSPLVSLPQSVVKTGTHNAYISHIDPVSGIYYVQLSENSLLLDEITEQLAHLGPSAEPEVYSPVGQACMAVYSEDQCYYRAVVSELHEEKGTSTLVYIDYGTSEEVTNSSLKVLPVPLRIHSPLAFKCTTNQSALTEMPTDQLITMLECKQWSVQIDGHTEPYNLVITDLQVSGGAEGIGKSLPSLPPSSTVCVDISPTRVLKCTRDEEIMISPIIPELQPEQTGLDVEDATLSSICSDEDTAVQAVPVDVFCAELCADIKRELLASAENRTAYLSDKVNEFVHSLSEALRDQVEGMKQEEKGECTAQEVVSYVSHRIICDILDKPPPQPLDASLSDKNTMMVEIQNIVSILLEEILKMNYEIVEHMCEEGAAAVDTLVASGGAPALLHYLSPMSSQTSTSSNALESSESVTTSLVPSGASEALDVVVASPTPSGDDQGQPDGLVTSPAPSSDDRAPSSIVTSPAQSGEGGAPGSAITSPAHRGDDRELVSVSTSSTPSGEEGAPGSVVTSPAPSRESGESGSVDASLAPSVEEGAPGSEVTSPTPSGEEGASDSVVTSPAPSVEEGAPGSVVTSSAPSRENGESGSVDTSLAPSVEEGAPGGEVASPTPSGDEKSPDIVTTSPATSSANRDISVGVTVSSGGDRAISDRNNASESCEQPLPSVTEVSSGTAQPVNGDGE